MDLWHHSTPYSGTWVCQSDQTQTWLNSQISTDLSRSQQEVALRSGAELGRRLVILLKSSTKALVLVRPKYMQRPRRQVFHQNFMKCCCWDLPKLPYNCSNAAW
jgi:hypothetical protein